MHDLHFAIHIIKDKLIGYVYVPFLLLNQGNFYVKHKRITSLDVKENAFPFTEWMSKLVELSNALTYVALNKNYNKKKSKISFSDFLEKTDKSKRDFIIDSIERKQIEIIKLIKENKPFVFNIKDRDANIYEKDLVQIALKTAEVSFEFEKSETNLIYRLLVFHNNKRLDLQDASLQILTNKAPVIVYQNKLIWFSNATFNGNKLKPFLTKDEITYAPRHEAFLFEKFIKPAVRKYDCNIIGFELREIITSPKAEIHIEKTIYNDFIFTPYFVYQERKVPFYASQKSFVKVIEKEGAYALENRKRDDKAEQLILEKLTKLGLVKQERYYKLNQDIANKYDFLEQISLFIPQLQQAGFSITNHLFAKEVSYISPKINYTTEQKQDWFDLYITVQFGVFTIEFQQLKNHILNHIHEYVLPDDTIAIIPKAWFSELQAFAKRTNKKNKTSLDKTHYKVVENNTIITPNTEIQESIAKFNVKKKLALPQKSLAQLRDYQITGYNWLYHMTQNQFGVCLADDMGLGKTLQVISLLQKYFENNPNNTQQEYCEKPTPTSAAEGTQLSLFDSPVIEDISTVNTTQKVIENSWESVLLIVPKSLIYNWILELEKFAPELSYVVYHKADRKEIFAYSLHKKNIIITTYGVARQDVDFLEKHHFSYLILDESQAIKNPSSKTYKAVTRLESQYKVSMTGTPIENNLVDLWTQMNFLNHDILGDLSYFRDAFVTPIQSDAEAVELHELKRIITPFILRRLKRDVAKELPEKIEQIIYCEMHNEQAEWYEEEKSAVRNELLSQKQEKGYIDALVAINRLRQIAIDPRLINPDTTMSSGKFDTIIQQIHSIIEQGDKFLIFSSFVKHLQLFQAYFETNDIAYAMLTGKDNKRQEIVEEFENTPSIKPFLISIKAGGVGINLTSANYVFIIDPWWNPFVEQQAIDRTHRIGQDKNVMVYRFISKDTIEEKILNLQQSKLKMSDALLEQDFTKNMKLKDIMALME